ncbi:hypothetical protein F4775DRAFT_596102 [Biscogniauxia sp. FL1348]|nr:hypothetical protein F4775DRAFT_596102 [Biscogniauxia sp. FL1348]
MCRRLYIVYPYCYHLFGSSPPELQKCSSVPPGRTTCAEVTSRPMPRVSHHCGFCAPARQRFHLALSQHIRLYVNGEGHSISAGDADDRLSEYRWRHKVAAMRVAQRLQGAYLRAFWDGSRQPDGHSEEHALLLALTRSLETINAYVEAKWSPLTGTIVRFEWGAWLPELKRGFHLFLLKAVGRGALDAYAEGSALCEVLYFAFFDFAGWCHPIRGAGYDEIAAVCTILLRNGIQDFQDQQLGGGQFKCRKLPTLCAQRPSSPSLERQPRSRTYPSDDPKLAHFYKASKS